MGENTIYKAEALGVGTTSYNLISIDGEDSDDSDGGNSGSIIARNFSLILLILLMFV